MQGIGGRVQPENELANLRAMVIGEWSRPFAKDVDQHSEDKQAYCSVCLDVFEGADMVVELRCDSNHIFHKACLESWLQRNYTCPLCRSDIREQVRPRANTPRTEPRLGNEQEPHEGVVEDPI